MEMNRILKEMGFTKKDKVVVVHADDVGVTQSSIDAYLELLDFGTISSGSTMVPCPWFPKVAQIFRENPQLDLGLHLTLNCEYETYRWRPVSNQIEQSGLIDEYGYFKQNKQNVMETGQASAVAEEIEAQIAMAKKLGVSPTHVDSHSGTLWNEKFIDIYLNIYPNHDILPVVFNFLDMDEAFAANVRKMFNIPEEKIKRFMRQNIPVVDAISGLPVEHTYDKNERFQMAKSILGQTEEGKLTHFAFHPMKNTPESYALNRYSEGRIADYEVFMQKEMKVFMKESGITLIGYQDLMKGFRKVN